MKTQPVKWKDIKGFKGLYQISNRGEVRRIAWAKGATIGKILKSSPTKSGYQILGLYLPRTDGVRRRFNKYIHILVAEAFIGPCPKGKEVNHIDRNKANNFVTNLEYLTRQENVAHAHANGFTTRGENNAASILNESKVLAIRAKRAKGVKIKALADEYGVSFKTIQKVVYRYTWKHI